MALRSKTQAAVASAAPQRDPSAMIDQLGAALVGAEATTAAHLAMALAGQPVSEAALVDALVRQGDNVATITRHWAAMHSLPAVDLRQVTPDAETIARLEEPQIRALRALPYRTDSDGVHVAIADPSTAGRKQVSAVISGSIRFHVAPSSEITDAVDRIFRADAEIDSMARALAQSDMQRTMAIAARDDVDNDAPIVQIVNRLIGQGMRDRASDIHIEPLDDRIRIRFRIDGHLVEAFSLPLSASQPRSISRLKIMAADEHRREAGARRTASSRPRSTAAPLDVRVASRADGVRREDRHATARQEPKSMVGLAELGMPARDRTSTYSKIVHAPFGMVICAGPTGAGKTTTLYATLLEINSTGKNVTTVEDPVEYVFPGINQVQTNDKAGPDVRHRPQGPPAPGPRRDPRRRDPRRRHGPHRHPVGAHRSLRALVAARHRLRRRPAPLARHGHRGVPRRLGGRRRRRPAPAAPDLRQLQGAVHARRRGARRVPPALRRQRQEPVLPRRRVAATAPTPATATASACTNCCASPPSSAA